VFEGLADHEQEDIADRLLGEAKWRFSSDTLRNGITLPPRELCEAIVEVVK